MSTHVPGVSYFAGFLHQFVLTKLATSSIRINTKITISNPRKPPTIKPFTLRDPLEIIVCYSDTFQNNLGIKQKFTKKLKESCWLTSLLHFSFNYFAKNAFVRNIFPKLSCLFWLRCYLSVPARCWQPQKRIAYLCPPITSSCLNSKNIVLIWSIYWKCDITTNNEWSLSCSFMV